MSESRPVPHHDGDTAAAADQPAGSQRPGSRPADAQPVDAQPVDAQGAGSLPGDSPTPDESADDEPQFVNRAARRAKGTPKGRPQSFVKGQAPVGRGAVQNPRQYGARRSG